VKAQILKRLLRGPAKINRYVSSRALILLYHRIAEADSDPWQLAVTPGHFEEHLQILSRLGRIMPLHGLAVAVQRGTLPRRAVIVTFDDGYADNLSNAKPLLQKYEVPATVFITTGYTGEDRELWWDELDKLFLQPGALPSELTLTVNGTEYHWELGEANMYEDANLARNLGWKAWQENDPTSRHSIYRSLWSLMHPLPDSKRRQIGDELLEWAGATRSARPTRRPLSASEIGELTNGGLIEIGCHTVTHPQLSKLTSDVQRGEICHSKASLEEILGKPVGAFAYPYGRECDYTGETITIVRDAGFYCACSTSTGVVRRSADPFQLPRLQVPDVDGDSFARILSEWLQ
jgi:peptidoglycan/xylan/chitin deacetylase (PgdA/CDA1 family)